MAAELFCDVLSSHDARLEVVQTRQDALEKAIDRVAPQRLDGGEQGIDDRCRVVGMVLQKSFVGLESSQDGVSLTTLRFDPLGYRLPERAGRAERLQVLDDRACR